MKEVDGSISNRRIAKMLGFDESTVRKDIRAGFPAVGEENTKQNKGEENDSAGNPAPTLSGEEAAKLAAKREERLSDRRQPNRVT